jgi:hypothetical protein
MRDLTIAIGMAAEVKHLVRVAAASPADKANCHPAGIKRRRACSHSLLEFASPCDMKARDMRRDEGEVSFPFQLAGVL